jgi:hypothetical protein
LEILFRTEATLVSSILAFLVITLDVTFGVTSVTDRGDVHASLIGGITLRHGDRIICQKSAPSVTQHAFFDM